MNNVNNTGQKKVLLLSTDDCAPVYSDRIQILKSIASVMEGTDVVVDCVLLENLEFSIINNVSSIKIVESNRAYKNTGSTIEDIADYDLVYVKNWKAHADIASAIAIYLNSKNVKLICGELNNFRVVDKGSEAFILAANGIPYPDTLFAAHSKGLLSVIGRNTNKFKFPMVMKAVDGSAGQNNFLVNSLSEIKGKLDDHEGIQFMVQNLIPNDGDHRIIMLGFEPVLSFKRVRVDDSTHLNNTSQGASATLTSIGDYSGAVIEDCRKASHLVNREIAGVDVLFNNKTGEYVILEVNASPQIATGAFLKEKSEVLKKYFTTLLEDKQ